VFCLRELETGKIHIHKYPMSNFKKFLFGSQQPEIATSPKFPILMGLFIYIISSLLVFPEGYDRGRYLIRSEWAADDSLYFLQYFVVGDQKDYLFYSLMWLASYLGIDGNVYLSLINAATAFIILYAIQRFSTYKHRIIILLIATFSILNISLFSGVRFYFALALFLVFTKEYIDKKTGKSALYLSIASLIHFSFFPFFLAYFIKNKIIYNAIFVIAIVLGLFQLAGLFDPLDFVARISQQSSYASLETVSEVYKNSEGVIHRNLIFYIIQFWLFVPIIYILIMMKNNSLKPLLIINTSILLLFLNNYPVFGRYFISVIYLTIIYLARDYKCRDRPVFLALILLGIFMRLIVDIHDNWPVYSSLF